MMVVIADIPLDNCIVHCLTSLRVANDSSSSILIADIVLNERPIAVSNVHAISPRIARYEFPVVMAIAILYNGPISIPEVDAICIVRRATKCNLKAV